MPPLVIHAHSGAGNDPCALCGKPALRADGLQLVLPQSLDPVCRDCGKKHAPSLVGLLDLARTADRVGRIGRHTVFPPLAALLDLAHAAEDFLNTKPPRHRKAV